MFGNVRFAVACLKQRDCFRVHVSCVRLFLAFIDSFKMTRYARAIGSKASNARVKGDPTPWSEMAPTKTSSKRNAESIEDDEVTAVKEDPQTPLKKVAKIVKLDKTKVTPKIIPKSKLAKKEKTISGNSKVPVPSNQEEGKLAVVTPNKMKKKTEEPNNKTKKKTPTTVSNGDSGNVKESIETKTPSIEVLAVVASDAITSDAAGYKPSKPKKAKKKQKKLINSIHQESTETQAEESNPEAANEKVVGKETKKEEKKKIESKKKLKKSEKTNYSNNTSDQKNAGSTQKKARGKRQSVNNISEHVGEDTFKGGNNKTGYNLVDDGSGRLKKIKIQCLRCRRMGHRASECRQERKGKLCYKCGDTLHTSRECSIKEEVYKFAECFICRQTGHLTRSCPNNTKGIYPHGGACFKCGENTHLAKNCPSLKKVEDEKTDSNETRKQEVFVGLLDVKESGDADVSESINETPINRKRKKQVVKF